jgi:hypothetical protein
MQKKVTYLVVAATIILAALMSCNKTGERSNECTCIYTNNEGANMGGGDVISDEIRAMGIMMYPNPVVGKVCLDFKTEDVHLVSIADKRGKVLFNQSFNTHHALIDVSDYSVGKYWVTIDNGKQKATLCLFKK